ncbi:hypothetical protein AgCh_014325 [Apium graveolens]
MEDILIAVSSTLVWALVGVELEPASNEPYLSTSLQDFWGKRWNLTVTTTLRETVYQPVRKALEKVTGKDLAPVPAVIATFLVSGLMHELGGGRAKELGAGAGMAAPVGVVDGTDSGICGRDESLAIFPTINKEWCRYKSAGGDDIFCQVCVESPNQAILVHS